MMSLRFVKSEQGKDKLLFGDYLYIADRKKWRCDREAEGCKGRISIIKDTNDVKLESEHTCKLIPNRVQATVIIDSIRREALTNNDKASMIVTRFTANLGADLLAVLPKKDSLRRLIDRARKREAKRKAVATDAQVEEMPRELPDNHVLLDIIPPPPPPPPPSSAVITPPPPPLPPSSAVITPPPSAEVVSSATEMQEQQQQQQQQQEVLDNHPEDGASNRSTRILWNFNTQQATSVQNWVNEVEQFGRPVRISTPVQQGVDHDVQYFNDDGGVLYDSGEYPSTHYEEEAPLSESQRLQAFMDESQEHRKKNSKKTRKTAENISNVKGVEAVRQRVQANRRKFFRLNKDWVQ